MKKIVMVLLMCGFIISAWAQQYGDPAVGDYYSNSRYYNPPRNMSRYYYEARFGGSGIPVSLAPVNLRYDDYYTNNGRIFTQDMLYDNSLPYYDDYDQQFYSMATRRAIPQYAQYPQWSGYGYPYGYSGGQGFMPGGCTYPPPRPQYPTCGRGRMRIVQYR